MFCDRAVFAARLEVGGAEGTLSALTVVCGQLASVREKKREALRELQDKRQQIEQFTQIAVSGCIETSGLCVGGGGGVGVHIKYRVSVCACVLAVA